MDAPTVLLYHALRLWLNVQCSQRSLPVEKTRQTDSTMRLIFGLAILWSSINLSRFQCVLEKEYFCSSVPNDFPQGLTSLLFVVTNLGVINATVFSSPSLNSVTSLALANSGITRIEPGAFHAFQSLTKLSLYQNSLTDVTGAWLQNPGRLENLTVAQNLVAEISPNMLFGFSNLSTLNLANNRISRISSGSFKDLSRLTFLDLSGNNLTTLTRTVFSGLVAPTLKLGGNPWNCSCDLQDFGLYLQELKNGSQLEDAESVLCRSPPSLEGVHVWNISGLNCSLDLLSSTSENNFHKVGLPVLLGCVAFISFASSLILIWKMKLDRQVRPCKEPTGLTTHVQPHDHVASLTESKPHNEKVRAVEATTFSRSRPSKARPKSATAVLLRTEFCQTWQQRAYFAATNPEHRIPLVVATNDQSFVSSEEFGNFMKLWLKEGQKEALGSFLTDVQETSETKRTSGGEKQIYVGSKNPAPPKEEEEDDKGHDSFENPEPFLYLSITTAPKEAISEDPQKDVAVKPNGGHLASREAKVPLKRSLTWPYEQNLVAPHLNALRDPNLMQFFPHTLTPRESVGAGKPEYDEKQPNEWSKREQPGRGDGDPVVSTEARPDLASQREGGIPEAELASQREAGIPEAELASQREAGSAGNSDEGLKGGLEIQVCPSKDNLVRDVELNTKEVLTHQPGLPFRHESEATGMRGARTWQPRIKTSTHPVVLKNKPSLQPEASRSGPCRGIQPPLDHTSPTSSIWEGALVENNYMNLLYEVVENRGRWTRERWKQTHQTGAFHDRPAKFK